MLLNLEQLIHTAEVVQQYNKLEDQNKTEIMNIDMSHQFRLYAWVFPNNGFRITPRQEIRFLL